MEHLRRCESVMRALRDNMLRRDPACLSCAMLLGSIKCGHVMSEATLCRSHVPVLPLQITLRSTVFFLTCRTIRLVGHILAPPTMPLASLPGKASPTAARDARRKPRPSRKNHADSPDHWRVVLGKV